MCIRDSNYIDTARGYTVSEEYLGYGLEGIREDFVLATKSMARTAQAMAADIDTSLRNLRTDFIDLYQLHNPSLAQLEQVMAPGALWRPCWRPGRREKSATSASPPTLPRFSPEPWSLTGWRLSCSPTTSWRIRGRR